MHMRSTTRSRLAAALAILLPAACLSCTKARPDAGAALRCAGWQDDIAPLFAARCASCHAGEAPAGGYRTDSYLGALGAGGAPAPAPLPPPPAPRVATAGD